MPIKAEHDREQPKTKTQNKTLQNIAKKLLSLAKCSIVEKRKGSKEKWQKQKQSALKTLRKQDL